MALEQSGFTVTFANDISPVKRRMYEENFGGQEFLQADIRDLGGVDVPTVDLATASFPCTDLSIAGNRAGLKGRESGLLGDFLRILEEMGDRRPRFLLIENVSGFATSDKGRDVVRTLEFLSGLGYSSDIVALDARRFVPQSRPRIFILCDREVPEECFQGNSLLRPAWASALLMNNPSIRSYSPSLPIPPDHASETLEDIVELFDSDSAIWWDAERMRSFFSGMSQLNLSRTEAMRTGTSLTHSTAFRRTRNGRAVWEIRRDNISGCLRTARGGSSKQAVVEGGQGRIRVRWMTAREYARLQGAPDFAWGEASDVQARFALGDAVCVPAVAWLLQHFSEHLSAQPLQRETALA